MRKWNSERPLVFATVVLCQTTGVRKSHQIRARLKRCMDLWEDGKYAALVCDFQAEGRAREGFASNRTEDDESRARRFNGTVLSGKLRAAVRRATARQGGGVLLPTDL
jgi:hypothetical protein